MADIWEKGKRLFDLCDSDENDIDRISHLLDDLSEDERIDVVNYRNEVSEILIMRDLVINLIHTL